MTSGIPVRVPPKMYKRLRSHAFKVHKPMSEVVALALKIYFDLMKEGK